MSVYKCSYCGKTYSFLPDRCFHCNAVNSSFEEIKNQDKNSTNTIDNYANSNEHKNFVEKRKKTYAIISAILGFLSIPTFISFGFVFAIISIIFGILSFSCKENRPLAIMGFCFSSFVLIMFIFVFFTVILPEISFIL